MKMFSTERGTRNAIKKKYYYTFIGKLLGNPINRHKHSENKFGKIPAVKRDFAVLRKRKMIACGRIFFGKMPFYQAKKVAELVF